MAYLGKTLQTAAVIEGTSYEFEYNITASAAKTIVQDFIKISGPNSKVVALVWVSGSFPAQAAQFAGLPYGSLVVSTADTSFYLKNQVAGTNGWTSSSLAGSVPASSTLTTPTIVGGIFTAPLTINSKTGSTGLIVASGSSGAATLYVSGGLIWSASYA